MSGVHPNARRLLQASFLGERVVLRFKLGLADGIRIQSRRGEETEFSSIAEDEPSPVIDSRPKLDPREPEVRAYRAIVSYWTGTSQLSEEVVCTVP